MANWAFTVRAEMSTSLMVEGRTCPRCAAAVLTFEAPPKGLVEICTRKGCGWQRWEEVDVASNREYIEIQVCDTGCGISAENILKIYEPFHSTKGAKGTGLGLAVVWGIIDSHNGTIHVESVVGKGATFTVRIPAKS